MKDKGRAIFLWQRSIVTETITKYLRSHTAKETLSKKLCQCLFVCFAGLSKGRGSLSHPTSFIKANKLVKTLSHFQNRYRETLSIALGKDLGLHEQVELNALIFVIDICQWESVACFNSYRHVFLWRSKFDKEALLVRMRPRSCFFCCGYS